MSRWISVHGKTKDEQKLMKKIYPYAIRLFRDIHIVFESDKGTFEHDIVEKNSEDEYWWIINCHWDSGEHLKQTIKDIKNVLKKLKAPKLKIHSSP